MSSGAPSAAVSLVKAHRDRWPDPTEAARLRQVLAALGLSPDETRTWMAGSPRRWTVAEAVTQAARWKPASMPVRDAIEWAAARIFDPTDAVAWRAAGLSSAQAVFVHEVVLFADHRIDTDGQWSARERAWQASGLPPEWIVLGVALGVNPAEAEELRTRIGSSHREVHLLQGYAKARGADPVTFRYSIARLTGHLT